MEARVRELSAADSQPPAIFRSYELRGPAIRRKAWFGSLLLHAAVVGALIAVSSGAVSVPTLGSGHVATLVAPPRELTSPGTSRGSEGRELRLQDMRPRPPIHVPPAIPAMSKTAPLQPAAPPQTVTLPEPPSVDTAKVQVTPPNVTQPPPPPKILPEEKPKLAFENPSAPKPSGLPPGTIRPPSDSILDATRDSLHSSHGAIMVGDADLSPSAGLSSGIFQQPVPAAGKSSTALEMQSDPMGVDFRPYLIRILAIVKQNWLMVYPESARMGRQGRTQILFIIDRRGYIPKLVIGSPSGTDALDRAAVAGISASQPFPPLPTNFKGSEVRLQFTFSYNLK